MKKIKDEFVVGKNSIGYVDSDFKREYEDVELPSIGAVLKSFKLQRSMNDSEIFNEFKIQECTLADVLETLKNATSEMKDGYSNLFYIKDHPSRVVRVIWGGDIWRVFVCYRGDDAWGGDGRVFSPATGPQILSSSPSASMTLDEAIKICKENSLKVIRVKTIEEEL